MGMKETASLLSGTNCRPSGGLAKGSTTSRDTLWNLNLITHFAGSRWASNLAWMHYMVSAFCPFLNSKCLNDQIWMALRLTIYIWKWVRNGRYCTINEPTFDLKSLPCITCEQCWVLLHHWQMSNKKFIYWLGWHWQVLMATAALESSLDMCYNSSIWWMLIRM